MQFVLEKKCHNVQFRIIIDFYALFIQERVDKFFTHNT